MQYKQETRIPQLGLWRFKWRDWEISEIKSIGLGEELNMVSGRKRVLGMMTWVLVGNRYSMTETGFGRNIKRFNFDMWSLRSV